MSLAIYDREEEFIQSIKDEEKSDTEWIEFFQNLVPGMKQTEEKSGMVLTGDSGSTTYADVQIQLAKTLEVQN